MVLLGQVSGLWVVIISYLVSARTTEERTQTAPAMMLEKRILNELDKFKEMLRDKIGVR